MNKKYERMEMHMWMFEIKSYFMNRFSSHFLCVLLSGLTILIFSSCGGRTVSVYHPPRFDLAQFNRLGVITFSDNAQPSVAEYATDQFQNQIHSAQVGIPILELGTEESILKNIGSNQLDSEAMLKIGQQYKVSAVFSGSIVYSDVKTDVDIKDITRLKASVKTTLHATLSVKLTETEGGATIWSDSTSWDRKLGNVSVSENRGVSIGTNGYDDAYRKLVPDMVSDITSIFRGYYIKERVKD